MKDELPTTVRGCGRCGGEHDDLDYRAFRQPVPDVDGDFTHWACCPETGDPILLRFMDVDALSTQLEGHVALAGYRWASGEWQPLPVQVLAELLRQAHEPRQWDKAFVYLGAAS